MATLVTRAGKGSALTNNEVDANFINLNADFAYKAPIASPTFTGQVTLEGSTNGSFPLKIPTGAVPGDAFLSDGAVWLTADNLYIRVSGSSRRLSIPNANSLLLHSFFGGF